MLPFLNASNRLGLRARAFKNISKNYIPALIYLSQMIFPLYAQIHNFLHPHLEK